MTVGRETEGERWARRAELARVGDPRAAAGTLLLAAGGGVLHADAAALSLLARVDTARVEPPWETIAGLLSNDQAAPGPPRATLLPLRDRGSAGLQTSWALAQPEPLLLCLVWHLPPGTVVGFEAEVEQVGLSRREREVCMLVIRGLRNRDVALELGCAPSTVRLHLMSIFRKARVRSRAELAARFLASAL